ncbi:hypothetical protein BB560_006427, partial [Smittium megazygosporum]
MDSKGLETSPIKIAEEAISKEIIQTEADTVEDTANTPYYTGPPHIQTTKKVKGINRVPVKLVSPIIRRGFKTALRRIKKSTNRKILNLENILRYTWKNVTYDSGDDQQPPPTPAKQYYLVPAHSEVPEGHEGLDPSIAIYIQAEYKVSLPSYPPPFILFEDNIAIVRKTEEECHRHIMIISSHLQNLGYYINVEKSITVPSTSRSKRFQNANGIFQLQGGCDIASCTEAPRTILEGLGSPNADKKYDSKECSQTMGIEAFEKAFMQDQKVPGAFKDRHVRIGTEEETPTVLLAGTGSTITEDKCTNASMAQKGGICQSTTDASTANTTASNTRTATNGNISAQLALTALVSFTTETSTGTTNGAEIRSPSMDNASMVRIGENEQGLTKAAIQLISESVRPNNKRNYSSGWKKFKHWAADNGINPLEYSPVNLANFLEALTTQDRRVKKLLKGLKRRSPKKPLQAPTWGIAELLKSISLWGPNTNLSLLNLGKKVAILLALATSWRPQSELQGIHRSAIRKADDSEAL